VNDPSGKQNLIYKAKNTMVVHEPQFIARPDAVDEDDGVLIIRGQDVESEKGKS
jgi:carotenoid cleavage dioxygenase-like enzyme